MEKEALALADGDIELPDGWHYIFHFSRDNTFSMITVTSKMWPDGMMNYERLSLEKGKVIRLMCGKNYDRPEWGTLKVQGDKKYLSKVMTQINNLRKGGHNASQIDCEALLKQFSGNVETANLGSFSQKYPKTRDQVEITVANGGYFDNDDDDQSIDDDEIPDLPETKDVVSGFLREEQVAANAENGQLEFNYDEV